MKFNQLLLLAGLCMSVGLTSCEKDDAVPPLPDVDPVTGTPSTPPGNGPAPGNGNTETPPPINTPGNTPPVGPNSLLTQMGTIQLDYDAQNRLTAYDSYSHLGYTVVYEGDKPVRLNYKHGGYLLYTYAGDKVSEAVAYNGYNEVSNRYNFEYNGDKLIKEKKISYITNPEGWLVVSEYSYDSNRNLTQIAVSGAKSGKEEDLSQPSIIKYGDYDDHPNPKPYAESHVYLPGIKLFNNNPGFRSEPSSTVLYTYLYHDSGLPKVRYEKLASHPHQPALQTSYLYK